MGTLALLHLVIFPYPCSFFSMHGGHVLLKFGFVFDWFVGKKQSSYSSANSTGSTSTEELWQAFFVNPMEWWDNRKNKVDSLY